MRRPTVILAVVLGLVLPVAVPVASPALAAAGPTIQVHRADALMVDPLTVDVAALAADGTGAPFTATVLLSVGRTRSSVRITAPDGVGTAVLPTAALQAGSATLRVTATVRGRKAVRTLAHFADVPPSLGISAFGCTAIPAGGGAIRWAVDRMSGDPIRTPNSRDVPLLPYVGSSRPRWTMTTEAGLPMRTSGTVTLLSGTKAVAKQTLAPAVRRLVFGTTWTGKVGGRFAPGAYTARLVLRDAVGRTTTALQPVQVVAAGTQPCGT